MEFEVDKLVCYGCAHSAAMEPYPSRPSGERPCCFCIRNLQREQALAEHEASGMCRGVDCKHPLHGYWYNKSPAVKVPMDAYHSLDMLEQQRAWERASE